MKKLFKSVALATVASGALLSSAVNAADQKIAVVNFKQVMSEIPQTAAVRQTLEEQFKDSRAELTKLKDDFEYLQAKRKKEELVLTPKQKEDLEKQLADTYAQYQEKGQKLQQEAGVLQNQESNRILALVNQAVEAIAKKEKYTIVVRREALAFANVDADISAKVIENVSKLSTK